MTYLFVLIALPVDEFNLDNQEGMITLGGANFIVLAVLYWLEQGWGFHYESAKFIRYERD